MSKILDKISLLLLFFIPIALVTGPFLADLSLSIIVIIFLYKVIKYDQFQKLNNKYFLILILICFFLIINSLLSDNIYLSIKPTLFYFRFGVFCFAIFYLMEEYNEKIIKNLFYIISLILFLLLIGQIYDLIFQKNILTGERIDNFRHTSLFGDDEVIGSYVARLLPFFLFIALKQKKINQNIIFILMIVAGCIVFLSSERTSFFFYTITLVIFISLSEAKLRKIIFLNLLILLSILGVFFLTNSDFNHRVHQTYNQIFNIKGDTSKIVIFSETHQSHYQLAYKMFREKPMFGHGVKMFRDYCGKDENYVNELACTTHPHNVAMQFLAETGVIFTIIIYFFYLLLIWKIIQLFLKRNFKKNYVINYSQICFLISLLITFFPFSPSGNFFDNWLSVVYYYPLGIYLWNMKQIKS